MQSAHDGREAGAAGAATGDYDWNSGPDERSNVRPINLYSAKIRA